MACAFMGWRSPLLPKPSKPLLAVLGLALLALIAFPSAAKAWWNDDWTYRKELIIDAGPKGAALPGDPGRMPVLIRLHDGNFSFATAKDDGSDLRFIAEDDKTPLKFHIESYDGVLGMAFVWLDLPVTVKAPTHVFLYWGNPKAVPGGDAPGTYDGDTVLVYHFAERNAPPRDQTADHNNAQNAAISIDASLIGSGVRFDGTNPITIPASPSLAIAQGGAFTWSAWVKPGDPQSNAVIFARHDGDHALVIGLDQNIPYVSISDGTATSRTTPIDAVKPGSWHHLAVTASDHVTLYVDGQPRATLAVALPALNGPASLGGDVAAAPPAAPGAPGAAPGAPGAPGAAPATPPAAASPATPAPAPGAAAAPTAAGDGFIGELDEVEISKTARSAAFIAAAAASQGQEAKLVGFGADQQRASWFSGGYLGVILKSVTVDGWVVIGLLVIMAMLSWVVMVSKTLYISRLARANDGFLRAFAKTGADLERFEAEMAAAKTRQARASSLFRIYHAGVEELSRRFAGADEAAAARILSPQALATVRAVLDRVATRETQRLNRAMVLLTIAISGGPFLGLLGTVVGVMITFAAIAASGDVNINAIAPGMAAALVATVAGLSVAIPALFGYNYLISRIKDATTDMQVFVEELATRLAETYGARHQTDKLAAE